MGRVGRQPTSKVRRKKIEKGESRRGKGRDIHIYGEIGGPVRDIP